MDLLVGLSRWDDGGGLERWYKTFKSTALRPAAPSTIDEARRVTAGFIEHYNARRVAG